MKSLYLLVSLLMISSCASPRLLEGAGKDVLFNVTTLKEMAVIRNDDVNYLVPSELLYLPDHIMSIDRILGYISAQSQLKVHKAGWYHREISWSLISPSFNTDAFIYLHVKILHDKHGEVIYFLRLGGVDGVVPDLYKGTPLGDKIDKGDVVF